jgi:uncharacterized damage-inducible protein DinB
LPRAPWAIGRASSFPAARVVAARARTNDALRAESTMQFKQYLLDTFEFNDRANRKLLAKVRELRQPDEAIKLLSHLVNSQKKWMARIMQVPDAHKLDWWKPQYRAEELESEWARSLTPWLEYIASRSDEELATEVTFVGYDGARFAATPKDIALQLNYHSIHHRAQIQMILRQQGVEPEFIDYIGTKYRRLS